MDESCFLNVPTSRRLCGNQMKGMTVLPLRQRYPVVLWIVLDIAANKFSGSGCKLSLLQKDLKLAINMSDAVDQPLHVSSAVNEVRCRQQIV